MLTSYSDDAVPAGFVVRFFAYCFDLLIKAVLILALRSALLFLIGYHPGSLFSEPLLFNYNLLDITAYLLGAAYFIVFTWFSGATAGKRFFRLKVVSSGDEPVGLVDVIYRETIGRYLSSLLCLGYLYAAFNSKKQGLHDVLSNTRVVYAIKPDYSAYIKNARDRGARGRAWLEPDPAYRTGTAPEVNTTSEHDAAHEYNTTNEYYAASGVSATHEYYSASEVGATPEYYAASEISATPGHDTIPGIDAKQEHYAAPGRDTTPGIDATPGHDAAPGSDTNRGRNWPYWPRNTIPSPRDNK